MSNKFINRDISWLSFNERVLQQAERDDVPLLERFKFLSIYSSNLDEFYRVRMPAIIAISSIVTTASGPDVLNEIEQCVGRQQERFGHILRHSIIPELAHESVYFVYDQPVPEQLLPAIHDYFLSELAAYLQPVFLKRPTDFFPENNKIYFLITLQDGDKKEYAILNIPGTLNRFYKIKENTSKYIFLIDDIIRLHAPFIFNKEVAGCYSFKITRDAELELQDEYVDNLAEKIEEQIAKRDFGLATRMLYDAAMPEEALRFLIDTFNLEHANIVAGGRYHNLKDLADFPLRRSNLQYPPWPALPVILNNDNIFSAIAQNDILIHTPYNNYDNVLRFFNHAAIDENVSEIYITLYRIAKNSLIAQALISAAKNGKKVTVFVELKARFDEANNIKWAKKMKHAGVHIIYSIPGLKVHAKVALVKRRENNKDKLYGLLATGNFNEATAKLYTDHILFTADENMLSELYELFTFLEKRKQPGTSDLIPFHDLLVAQFNLRSRFLMLIDTEIANALAGKEAKIIIKMNNLEEPEMIKKLYEASQAGVRIQLIIRSICRLKPGVKELSDNIEVHRIVDRYLEHGRIFLFHNGGDEEILLGSADWMNRNIHRRIEVCFPVKDIALKEQLKNILMLQWSDNINATIINDRGENELPDMSLQPIRSQEAIYTYIKSFE